MDIQRVLGSRLVAVALVAALPASAAAQPAPAAASPPARRVTMEEAVRLALVHNHQLRADRLNVEGARADEITAALKPNPVFTSTNASFPIFSPSQLTWNHVTTNQTFVEAFSYLIERGGKREKRAAVARDATHVAERTAEDAERQLVSSVRGAFIDALFAQSTRELAQANLKDFSAVVDVNRERVRAGDLAESEFLSITLQQLQFEQDLASSDLALAQARAALRQAVGVEALAEDFGVDGTLAYTPQPLVLAELTGDALASRPDLRAAHEGVTQARDGEALAHGNRARDVTSEVEYDRDGPSNGIGVGFSIELPFHDRNQGNIAHSQIAVRQAVELEAQTRAAVMTDVANAFAALQNSAHVVALFETGYLARAQQALDIARYAYGRGGATLLDLLDAERTNRATQLAYRQALAAAMASAQQINLAVGKQVVP